MKLFGYDFSITKQKKIKKKTGFSSKRWSTVEKNTLLRFHGENKSAQEIGVLLNRTTQSISAMLYKLHKDK